jgi:hypothetical protein
MTQQEAADTMRVVGNAHFASGDFAQALTDYTSSIVMQPTAAAHSNAAAAQLKLSDFSAAEAHAASAMELDPLYAKAHDRRITALLRLNRIDEAAWQAVTFRGCHGRPPTDWAPIEMEVGTSESFTAVAKLMELALKRSTTFSVQRSGERPRSATFVIVIADAGPVALQHCDINAQVVIGMGSVSLRLSDVWVANGSGALCGLCGIEVTAGFQYPSPLVAAAEGGTFVAMNCRFDKCHSGALATTTGLVALHSTTVISAAASAVEVREGGRCSLGHCGFMRCMQGVVAYAGAASLSVEHCVVQDCGAEGMLLVGSVANAATLVQNEIHGGDRLHNAVARAASRKSTNQSPTLVAVVNNCSINGCRKFGISADRGAEITVTNTEIKQTDKAIYVIGGAHVSLANVLITKAAAGMHVGANYNGVIVLRDSVFAACRKDVVEEVADAPDVFLRLGWHSKRVERHNVSTFNRIADAPTMGQVRQLRASPDAPIEIPVATNALPDLSRRTLLTDFFNEYPIGNTAGVCAIDDPSGDVSVFLGGCGDVRNLLAYTLRISPGDAVTSLHVTLSDHAHAVLARDALLLTLLSDASVAPATFLAIWGNFTLTDSQRDAMTTALKLLLSEHADGHVAMFSPALRVMLARYWAAWVKNVTIDEVLETPRTKFPPWTAASRGVVLGPRLLRAAGGEIAAYMCGNLTVAYDASPPCHGNSSFLGLNGEYRVHPGTGIFRAIDLSRMARGGTRPLASALVEEVTKQVEAYRNWHTSGMLTVVLSCGDIQRELLACSGDGFDAIDLSNCCDYMSLPPLLIAAASCLKDERAVVTAQLLRGRGPEVSIDGLLRSSKKWARALGGSLTATRDSETHVLFVVMQLTPGHLSGITPMRRALELLGLATAIRNSDEADGSDFFCGVAAAVAAAQLTLPPHIASWIVQSPGMASHRSEMEVLAAVHSRNDTSSHSDEGTVDIITHKLLVTGISSTAFYALLHSYTVVRLATADTTSVFEAIEYDHTEGEVTVVSTGAPTMGLVLQVLRGTKWLTISEPITAAGRIAGATVARWRFNHCYVSRTMKSEAASAAVLPPRSTGWQLIDRRSGGGVACFDVLAPTDTNVTGMRAVEATLHAGQLIVRDGNRVLFAADAALDNMPHGASSVAVSSPSRGLFSFLFGRAL